MSLASVVFIEQYIVNDGWPGTEIPVSILNHIACRYDVSVITGDTAYIPISNSPFKLDPTIHICKCKTYFKGSHFIVKLINSLSFSMQLFFYLLRLSKPSLIVCQTNPPPAILICSFFSYLRQIPLMIISMDVYPDVLFSKSSRSMKKLLHLVNPLFKFAYSTASSIVSLSRDMQEILIEKGVDRSRIRIIPNWSLGELNDSSNFIYRSFLPDDLSEYCFKQNHYVLLYAGNLGAAHDWLTLAQAFKAYSPSLCKLLIVSNGREVPSFQKFVNTSNISNISFSSSVPLNRLNRLLTIASVGLVTLDKRSVGSVFPSKFASLLSRGIPILYIGPPSDISYYIDEYKIGFWILNDDYNSLVDLLVNLDNDVYDLRVYSHNAYLLYKSHFSKSSSLLKYDRIISQTSAIS